jgi:hypothetical protein
MAGAGTGATGDAGAKNSVIIGSCALSYGQRSCKWVAIGNCALCGFCSGVQVGSVVIGHGAARCKRCCIRYNVLIGYNVACSVSGNENNTYNVVVGHSALMYPSCSASSNVIMGFKANMCTTQVLSSIYLGYVAGMCAAYGSGLTWNDTVAGAKSGMYLGQASNSCQNVILGFCTANQRNSTPSNLVNSTGNIIIGECIRCIGATNNIIIGSCANKSGATSNTTIIYGNHAGNTMLGTRLCGCLLKGGGSFEIVHPNPAKSKDKVLYHSFVESPTRGDNLYRWSVDVKDRSHSIKLPNYYKHLNENTTIKISSVGHFGKAYGQIDKDQDNLIICTNQDGKYNVLVVATRCDAHALADNFMLEKDMNERDLMEFGVK